MIPVFLQELEFERVGDGVGRHPRFGFGFETADDQTADLLLEVGVAIRIAQDRQVGVRTLDGLGHHIEMLRGVERNIHTRHRPDLFCPLTGTVDHDLGFDIAGVGAHPADPAVRTEDIENAHSLEHPGSTLTGAFGERHRQICRIGLTVGG